MEPSVVKTPVLLTVRMCASDKEFETQRHRGTEAQRNTENSFRFFLCETLYY